MKANIGIKLSGKVKVEKWSEKRGTRQEMEFDNVILDVGWDEIWARFPGHGVFNDGVTNTCKDYYTRWLYLGTGTTEPTAADLGLEAVSTALGGKYMHSQTETTVVPSWHPFVGGASYPAEVYNVIRYRFDYDEGEAAGNWTELGLAWLGEYTKPLNRALFRDEHGVPVVVTVLPDEFLRIFVEIRCHWDCSEHTAAFNWNGTPITARFHAHSSEGTSWPKGLAAAPFFREGFPIYANLRTLYSNSNLPIHFTPADSSSIYAYLTGYYLRAPIPQVTYSIDFANRSCRTDFKLLRNIGCDPAAITGFGFSPEILEYTWSGTGCGYSRNSGGSYHASFLGWMDSGDPVNAFHDIKEETEDLVGSIEIQFSRAA